MNQMKTYTRRDPRRAHKMVNLQKVITRHKKPWYIKIVDKKEAEGTDIKTSLHVYDKCDDRLMTVIRSKFANLVYTISCDADS